MKSRLFGNLLLVLLAAAGLAPAAAAQDKSLLYEITGNGLTEPSYLYGTFHIVCTEDLVVNEPTAKALTDAKQLYLELDLDDPALQTSLITNMAFSDARTLKDILTAEDYALIDKHLRQNNGPGLEQLIALKPIALLSFVIQGILQCETNSWDGALAGVAAQTGKEVFGLESVADQMAALDKIPMANQIRDLVDMVRQPEKARKELLGLMAAYKAQDLALLTKLIRESEFDSDSKLEDALLNNRNAKWIPVIEKASRAKPTFFAFGAAHLTGPKGVVNLLREKGYTVKPRP